MTQGKHTPGPWAPVLYETDGKHWDRGSVRVMRGEYFGRAVQARAGLKVVAMVPHCHADDDADARLIAAAPDMLEALRGLRMAAGKLPADLKACPEMIGCLIEADAAIAKATQRAKP